MGLKSSLLSAYDAQYKKLLVISVLLVIASFAVVLANYAQTGELFQKSVSLKGGITMTVPATGGLSSRALEQSLKAALPEGDLAVREITETGVTAAFIIEAADVSVEQLEGALSDAGLVLTPGEYSVENMGGSLGEKFLSQTIRALILAFIAMAVVVFITFRSVVPSSFVILAAVSDIVSTLAVVNLMGMKLGTAGLAAFLMLIGYSVDTDILLTTKVLKRRGEGGSVQQRIHGAMRTGLTMTGTALAATIIALIFTTSDTVQQIMLIVTIGLAFDLVYTWFQNAGILRWYMERKYGKS